MRGAARHREIAIRSALGAGRGRIVRQLLTESFTLALIGGLAGVAIARWSLDVLLLLSPLEFGPTTRVSLSLPVLFFTAAVSLLTALLAGVAPAFENSRANAAGMQDGGRPLWPGRSSRHLRDALVVAELALAFVLLAGAGLMSRSLGALLRVNPGFEIGHLLTMRTQLPAAKYGDEATRVRFFQSVESQLLQLSGVGAVGIISFLPLSGSSARTTFTIDGAPPSAPGQAPTSDFYACDTGHFQAMGLPLRQGRFFADRELREKSNVVLVNESLARTYFPAQSPIGRRIALAATRPVMAMEIVGVVGDVKSHTLSSPEVPTAFVPHAQLASGTMTLVVRTAGDPLVLAPSAERAVHSIDRDQPVSDVRTMTQWIARSLSEAWLNATLLASFSLIALILAVMGIYGVISYTVTLRTAEFGVRMAVGADASAILKLVLANGVRLTACGIGLGFVLALALNRTIASQLYQTRSTDPGVLAGVAVLLGGVALAASSIPARRAARVDPIVALRCD